MPTDHDGRAHDIGQPDHDVVNQHHGSGSTTTSPTTTSSTSTSTTTTSTTTPPVVPVVEADAGAPSSVDEGAALTLDGSATIAGPSATFTWDVNGDGTFGDATDASPTLSADQLVTLGLGDGPASLTVTLQVTEGATIDTDTTALTITNVAPTASVVTVPTGVVAGTSAAFTFGAVDPGAGDNAAGFTYVIDWGDGTPAQSVPGGGATVDVSHTYATDGTFTVSVTATDKDAGTSAPATGTVTVAAPLAPVAVADQATGIVGTPLTVNLFANDQLGQPPAQLLFVQRNFGNCTWQNQSPGVVVFDPESSPGSCGGFYQIFNASGSSQADWTVTFVAAPPVITSFTTNGECIDPGLNITWTSTGGTSGVLELHDSVAAWWRPPRLRAVATSGSLIAGPCSTPICLRPQLTLIVTGPGGTDSETILNTNSAPAPNAYRLPIGADAHGLPAAALATVSAIRTRRSAECSYRERAISSTHNHAPRTPVGRRGNGPSVPGRESPDLGPGPELSRRIAQPHGVDRLRIISGPGSGATLFRKSARSSSSPTIGRREAGDRLAGTRSVLGGTTALRRSRLGREGGWRPPRSSEGVGRHVVRARPWSLNSRDDKTRDVVDVEALLRGKPRDGCGAAAMGSEPGRVEVDCCSGAGYCFAHSLTKSASDGNRTGTTHPRTTGTATPAGPGDGSARSAGHEPGTAAKRASGGWAPHSSRARMRRSPAGSASTRVRLGDRPRQRPTDSTGALID